MNETAQDIWYFTHEGNRQGPVGFGDLKARAAEGLLDPRHDMVWTPGMSDWKPSGEIEGLFEKKAVVEEKESLAPKADPYTPPKSASPAELMAKENGWPGARRRMFLIMVFVFPILWQLGFGFGAQFLSQQLGKEIMTILTLVAGLVPLLVSIYYGLARLANVGMSRWWYLGNLVPILNFWVGYRIFACPAGYAYHKKMDAAGWVLAILYWLSVLAVLAILGVILAIFLGAVDNPELRERISEQLRMIEQQKSAP